MLNPTLIAEDADGNVCNYYGNDLSTKERGKDTVWVYLRGIPCKIFRGETASADAERFVFESITNGE